MWFWFLMKSLLRNMKFTLKRFLPAALNFFEKTPTSFHKVKFTTSETINHYCITTHFIYFQINEIGIKL